MSGTINIMDECQFTKTLVKVIEKNKIFKNELYFKDFDAEIQVTIGVPEHYLRKVLY